MNLTVKQKINLLTLLSWATCLGTVYYLVNSMLRATTVEALRLTAESGGEALLGIKMGFVMIVGLITVVKIMDVKFNLMDQM